MPLFKSKKSKRDLKPPEVNSYQEGNLRAAQHPASSHVSPSYPLSFDGVKEESLPQKPFKYAPKLSKISINIGGLPVSVYGYEELTPSTSRALAPNRPEIVVSIHMHGRGGSADNEEKIMRQLWDRMQRDHKSSRSPLNREFLIVGFDARNHGHRLTNEKGQKGWKQGNEKHALDLYSMIVGTAQDISFLVDFLPSYLFPQSDRKIVRWAITGKSLGGHAAWHVLANDPRIQIGVPFIGCPSFKNLLANRTRTSFVPNAPPHVPHALTDLIDSIDPASKDYESFDPRTNPFLGKKICICSGMNDKLVPWRCGESFIERLVVNSSPSSPRDGLRVVLLEDVGHEVTEHMIEEAGHWIWQWAVATP